MSNITEYTAKQIDDFSRKLAENITQTLRVMYSLAVRSEEHMAMKTNGLKQAITFRFEDSNIAPTIYPEDLYAQYQNGVSMEQIASQMSDVVYKAHMSSPGLPKLTAEEAKKHITLTLVNSKMNRDMLEKTPHFEILDGELSAIPRWYISDEASFVVSNEASSAMGLTPEEVLQIGQQNIDTQKYKVQPIQEVLSRIMGEDIPMMECPPLYVITAENNIQGSNALLSQNTLDEMHQKIGDFIILPSSTMEVLALPVNESMDPDELRDIVNSVNTNNVEPELRLSNEIFHYDGQKLRLVRDTLDFDTPKVEAPKIEPHKMSIAM